MTHQHHDEIDWREVSIEEIFEFAIADEEYARDYYKQAATLAGGLHTKRMLLQLSEMEQGHADTLRKELEELRIARQEEAGMAD
jgi:rubrerythrin